MVARPNFCIAYGLMVLIIALSLLTKAYSGTINTTVDHSKLPSLNKDFKSAEEVTRACLECHNLAAGQVKKNLHWTWEIKFNGRKLGKQHVINNY